MVVQLDLTTTVQSSLPAEVELESEGAVDPPRPNFIIDSSEGAHCDNGQSGEVKIDLGKLQPRQAAHSTMWIVLPNAIRPDRPHPTERQLGEEKWLMFPVQPEINDGSGSVSEGQENQEAEKRIRATGPRVITCEMSVGIGMPENKRYEYLAVSGYTPKDVEYSDSNCPGP